MTGRAVRRSGGPLLVAALLLTAGPPGGLAAQVSRNRATAYLHPSDVRDGRALWVNPAGVAVEPEASVYLDLTATDPGPDGRLGQLSAGLSSHGLAVGYQRDLFPDGTRGHTYRLGLAGAAPGLAAGFAATMYRGGTSATGYELGAIYTPREAVSLALVVANVGEPEVRGVEQRLSAIPGVTLRAVGWNTAFSAHARITADSVESYAFGARWSGRLGVPLSALARLDTDHALRRAAFVFGLTVGTDYLLGLVATTPGDAGRVDTASLYGVARTRFGRRP